jgi:hypothetical protein
MVKIMFVYRYSTKSYTKIILKPSIKIILKIIYQKSYIKSYTKIIYNDSNKSSIQKKKKNKINYKSIKLCFKLKN